ncbi:helix-turn-helix domain-containing protein [Phytoactinopolyspora halotolerans]|uniref:AraC family transcriptional regulator n=1 Tax=Phytoactinopolyspora halotolerans TaxID=1981512 RepID=A0A6L9SD58_9ACTN|nr:helix-turn-helix domain-containing protein [Phytoactinopolyspora halotolerans]NEE03053.1 AraC family transcriptional regulator [Phytoactinopolyspora halotolerans]
MLDDAIGPDGQPVPDLELDLDVPDYVEHALRIIHKNPTEVISTAQLAQQVSIGERSLQLRFKRHLGVTPMAYVRAVRLDRIREILIDSRPGHGPTLDRISREWGFNHYGHFAAEYRNRFGERPNETLRRRPDATAT